MASGISSRRPPRRRTCREVVGSLASGFRPSVDAHLAQCADCRAYLHQYEATGALCRAALAADTGLPEDLVHAILIARRAG